MGPDSAFTPLPREFYNAPTQEVAKALLGQVLIHDKPGSQPCAGTIVETEAYLSEGDPGCHAARGKTQRNAPMYERSGTAYVYLIYGMHYCLNVVTAPEGVAEAVLIRAVMPLYGLGVMPQRRKTESIRQLCSGPAKLCQAFGIDTDQNYADLTQAPLYISAPDGPGPADAPRIVTTTRIGLAAGRGDELPLRYYLADSPFVSRR